MKQKTQPLIFFLFTFFVTRLLLLAYLKYAGVGLMPDEAQYWTWSRDLDFGYYSKPPGIAWQIALSTHFFSFLSLDIAIRFFSCMIIPFICAWILVKILILITENKALSYFSGSLYLISPLGFMGSLFATTDSMMMVSCFTALFFLLKLSLEESEVKQFQNGLYAASWIAIGALWKWVIYLILPLVLYEYVKKSKNFYQTLLIFSVSLIGLIPAFYWNWGHNWVTYKHVQASITGPLQTSITPKQPIEFLLASTGLISWGFFLIGMYGLLDYKKYHDRFTPILKKLVIYLVATWSGLFLYSWITPLQGNWALIISPIFFIFLGLGCNFFGSYSKGIAIGIALISQIIAFGIHLVPYPKLVQKSPLKQGVGVEEIHSILLKEGYSLDNFLLSDRYQNISQIERYAPYMPKNVYFMNLWNLRMNQYSFRKFLGWEGKNGYFIAIIPEREMDMIEMRVEKYITALLPYFKTLEYRGTKCLNTPLGIPVRRLLIFYCSEYNGKTFPNLNPNIY